MHARKDNHRALRKHFPYPSYVLQVTERSFEALLVAGSIFIMACKADSDLHIMKKVQALHINAVSSFRECHHLCVSSNLFSQNTIMQVDQCALDFRQLSLSTVSVSERVSGWISRIITFFRYIYDETNREQKYIQFGGQAKDLARAFKVIAAWGRDVCGRLHETQGCLEREVDRFQLEFLAAKKDAEYAEIAKLEEYAEAVEIRADAEAAERRWKRTNWWNPIGLVGNAAFTSNTAKAVSLEREAEQEHDKAVETLVKKTYEYYKAKVSMIYNVALHAYTSVQAT